MEWCSVPGGAYEAVREAEGRSFTMKTFSLTPNGDKVYAYQLLSWSDVWE